MNQKELDKAFKNKVFTFQSDSGHGWLSVKRKHLELLGISDKITPYSYQNGKSVYLEEDCDVTTFVKALNAAGYEFRNKSGAYQERSWVRNLERYSHQA